MNLFERFKWLSITRVSSVIVAIFTILIIPQLFGEKDYATYVYLLSIIAIGFQFTGMGIEQSLKRFILTYRTKNNIGKVRTIITFSVFTEILTIIVIGIIYTLMYFIKPDFLNNKVTLLFIIIFAMFFKTLAQYIYQIDLGFERYGSSIILSAPTELLILISVISGYSIGGITGGLIGFTVSYAISAIITTLRLVSLLRKEKIFNRKKETISKKELFKFGLPIYISGNLKKISGTLAIIILGLFFGSSDPALGMFSISISLITILIGFVGTLMLSIYPELTKAKDTNNKELFNYILERIMKYTLIFSVTGYLFLLYYIKPILKILLPDYVQVADLIPIVGLTLISFGFMKTYGEISTTHQITRTSLEEAVVYLTLYVILYPFLIANYGGIGAAIAYTIINIVSTAFFVLRIKKITNVPIHSKTLIKILLTSTTLFIPLILPNNLITFPVFFIIWIILLKKIKIIKEKDIQIFSKLIKTVLKN